ncbi:MAG: DUF1501 domain-containing protein [Deltaproteobacteria bacterium]|nr:DUF1501 domain-containing protein [Deltaproteobacteria bacterium]
MDRREFLKLCSVAGLGVLGASLPWPPRSARGAPARFYLLVHADGGWDTTLLFDPKGSVANSVGDKVNEGFAPEQIGHLGELSFAPIGRNAEFFARFASSLMVIRGIDCQTNNHETGVRHTWSGRLAAGSPAFAALAAASLAPQQPLAFLATGGYDCTAGVAAAPSRVVIDRWSLLLLLHPERFDHTNPQSPTYHTAETVKRIRDARQKRTQALLSAAHLPRPSRALGELGRARAGLDVLAQMEPYLPDPLGSGFELQANVALGAFAAGLGACANLVVGAFDSHASNDSTQEQRLSELLGGIIKLYDRAAVLGIADKLVLLVGSDFGRSPRYNDHGGKDHWPVGGMMIMGPDIPGGRAIGATTDTLRPEPVDPDTLEVVGDGGVTMTPAHVHRWLRRHAGIDKDELVQQFPLDAAEELDFGGL